MRPSGCWEDDRPAALPGGPDRRPPRVDRAAVVFDESRAPFTLQALTRARDADDVRIESTKLKDYDIESQSASRGMASTRIRCLPGVYRDGPPASASLQMLLQRVDVPYTGRHDLAIRPRRIEVRVESRPLEHTAGRTAAGIPPSEPLRVVSGGCNPGAIRCWARRIAGLPRPP